ncbi:MAG: hypothetical protein GTN62_05390 [Gemmatimonadales bacterium]|nr:hypothetical protein [Gemmatimonadales bacterium]NIN10933.1 hypothetical protein [Gemmatimonadales bacterium]NIN49531.1 hypothetical protein [Gemmatimonadales bacterium]NIP06995.1 hypothetical protein [Gemmatimonadales bacterium]NIQ99054.1 hypothetical protein [Gemmatimonadales bacterium]
MRWKWVRAAAVALLVPLAVIACEAFDELDDLDVINENAPDTERALGTPGDIEALISSGFGTWLEATQGPTGLGLSTAGDELSMSWGNMAIKDLSSEPRVAWNNSSSYNYRYVSDSRGWRRPYRALSAMYDGLRAFDADPTLAEQIDFDRAKAYAKFVQGLAHGWIALQFDSGFIFDETVELETEVLYLKPYPDVMAAALGYLNDAITLAQQGSWSLPVSWINGNAFTASDIARLAHSYAARFMAQVARTPAERADPTIWQTIISHVDNGITADIEIVGQNSDPWDDWIKWGGAQVGRTWGRADYKTIGYLEAGAGLGYDNWLATPVAQRLPFDLDIPDRRVTPGPPPHTEFVSEGLDFGHWGQPNHPEARGTYHWSFYGHHRYRNFPESGDIDPFVIMTTEEMDLLKAEGLARLGQAGAAALVNNTRVNRGQLPQATDGDADLLEKIFYEMQIENFNVCGGCPMFNRRGWGGLQPTGPSHHFGLVTGTLVHFPLPGSELEILQKKAYTYGGENKEGSALVACGGLPTEPCPGGSAAPAFGAAAAAGSGVPARLVYRFNGLRTTAEKLEFIRGETHYGLGELRRYR